MKQTTIFCIALFFAATAHGEKYQLHTFTKHAKTKTFHCEGASVGDFNKDGHMDVVSGSYIYFGPDFSDKGTKFAYRPVREFPPTGYSDNFLTHVSDFNGDGYDDILIIGWPGYKKDHEHRWYENPAKAKSDSPNSPWKEHLAFKTVDNESPMLGDLVGPNGKPDGKPELVFHTAGKLGYAAPDPKNPTAEWKFHPISTKGKWQKYTHGIGFGDVNGDGRNDFLEVDGWWEQPASLEGDPVWKRHIWRFGNGGAQMFAYDVDGDGDNDVITSIQAHGFGLAWFEHYKDKETGEIKFKEHRFMDSKPEHNKYGIKFSQLHALDLIDMDKDGIKDIVTGKRYWAHGPKGDAEPNAPAVLYWFKIKRTGKAGGDKFTDGSNVDFIPHMIDNDSGVGTQVTARDITGDGYPDVVVGNKKGTFIFVHEVKKVDKATWEKAQPKVRGAE